MSLISEAIRAPAPTTTRGQPTPLSADAKGERIAYASNKSIFLRSIDHPETCTQYSAHTAQATVARFSPSGFYVASGDVSGSVRVWDAVGEGATKGEYHIIAGRINDIAWDGDSQRIIAVGEGKERFGHCITADSGNSVGEISGHSSQINAVSIRQQRPLRAATVSDDTSLVFYHGAPFKFNNSLRGNHNRFIYGTAFSPDGSLLVSVGSDRKIWLYDGKTGEPKQQIGEGEHKGSIFGVSWAKDSKQFVTASADQTVKIWDAESGKVTHTWRMGEEGTVSVADQQVGVVWPHGRNDGLIISLDLDGNLNYLYPDSSKPSKIICGHQKNVTALAYSTDNKSSTLWTGSSEGRVLAWDAKTGLASRVDGDGHSNYVSGLAASASDASRVYSIGWDDTIRTIDASTQSFTGSGTCPTNGQPRGASITKSGVALVAAPTGIQAFKDGQLTVSLPAKGYTPTTVAASPSSDIVAIGCEDKTIRIFSFSGGAFAPSAELSGTLNSPPSALVFSPTGAHLAAGTSGGQIAVFSTSDWSVATSRWSAHTARVTSLSWSNDGQYAVTGSLDTNVFVWSLKAPGKRIKAGNAHKDGVNGVHWVEEGSVPKVVSVGADAALKVWKVSGLE